MQTPQVPGGPRLFQCLQSLQRSPPVILIIVIQILVLASGPSARPASAFHLSFGRRLLRSAIPPNSNPQLNPASSLIRPIECRNANNHSEAGICMFSIDCMQNKGVPLSICKHNYFVGTCCRLPDYNNFVGIVYDLRDTETQAAPGAQLEARKSAVGPPPPASPAAAAAAPTTTTNTPAPPPEAPTTAAAAAVASGGPRDPSSSSPQPQQQQAAAGGQPAQSSNKLEDRYVISSTSLFPSVEPALGRTPSAASLQPASSAAPPPPPQLESARNADGQQLAAPATGANASNTAGNLVDSFQIQLAAPNATAAAASAGAGASPLSQLDQPVVILVGATVQNSSSSSGGDLATRQQQQQQLLVGAANASSVGYELLPQSAARDEASSSLNELQSVVEVLSSAHSAASAPGALPVASSQGPRHQPPAAQANPNQPEQPGSGSPSSSPSSSSSSSSLPLLEPASSPPAEPAIQGPTAGQPQSQLAVGTTGSSPTGAQEFSLSTSPLPIWSGATSPDGGGDSSSTTAGQPPGASSSSAAASAASSAAGGPSAAQLSSSSSSSSGSQQPAAAVAVAAASQGEASPAPQAPTQSPFVDLISSPHQDQTTTPFTSSLSTASLPSVSSHPYSPTPQPAAQNSSLVSTSTTTTTTKQQQQQQQQSSTATTTTTTTTTTASSSSQPAPTSESLPAYSQLYSNQHSASSASSAPSSSQSSSQHHQHQHHHQVLDHPLANGANQMAAGGQHKLPASLAMGLQAASKIVGATSSTNQLIPGLGGLQSAILSHIPFKLASGLSSYLQAAMKPTGSRPLISSNTAPALQYQHLAGAAANANATRPGSQQPPAPIRFPAAAAAAAAASSPATPQPGPASSSAAASSTTAAAAAPPSAGQLGDVFAPPRDVVREAQLVCGRPQVLPFEDKAKQQQQLQQLGAKKRVGRIVGGNQSLFGQWPWMVSLRQWRKGAFLHKCGAALLNENWAITAAHCVENVKAADLLLRLGEFDVSKQDEPYPYLERRVKTVVAHPSFDPKTFEYDLALLRFAEPIQYERNILPVCVPAGNDSYVDRMATVIGWGRLYEDGPLPDIIQHVDVPIITNNECERMYKNAGYIEEIPEMFICAGISKGGRDSCEGDSGGPLTMVDHDGRSYLVGIISWGIGCALPSQPGVYTRITAFSGWINEIVAS